MAQANGGSSADIEEARLKTAETEKAEKNAVVPVGTTAPVPSSCYPLGRSFVEVKRHYEDYRETVREDFWYCCSYCSIAETEALAIGFELDHYLPRKGNPAHANDFWNLIWACEKCNSRKRAYDSSKPKNPHHIILSCDRHDPDQHLKLEEDDRLVSTSETGRFNIERLDLNRLALIRLRRARKKRFKSRPIIQSGLRALLNANVDEFPPAARSQLMRIKSQATERRGFLTLIEKQIIKRLTKSDLIDTDLARQTKLSGIRQSFAGEGRLVP